MRRSLSGLARGEGTTKLSARVAVLLATLGVSATACSGFGAADAAKATDPAPAEQVPGGGPAAPPITGTPTAGDINEELGVFVSPNGATLAAGTRAQPLASIQAGIDMGKSAGKRVYVCTGTFKEALTLADSISVIGGLDCSDPAEWKIGAPRTRLEAPASPAITARNMTLATRVEGLDVVAPGATVAGESSFGLLAEKVTSLVFANSKITAGDGAKGDDGTLGIKLTQTGSPGGTDVSPSARCIAGVTCDYDALSETSSFLARSGPFGGTSVCTGAPGLSGINGEKGGWGGSPGLQEVRGGAGSANYFGLYLNYNGNSITLGQKLVGGQASVGTDGANAAPGMFSAQGYAPATGIAGTNGGPGKGGSGGDGHVTMADPAAWAVYDVFIGYSGASGGAGGCPGLAGGAGTGGGASVAALLFDSPVNFSSTDLVSGHGGDPGRGAIGSEPTPGGLPGANPFAATLPMLSAAAGSAGGAAGVSGNGSSGPSIGIAYSGATPVLAGKITPGTGGAAIGVTNGPNGKSIPATPAGLSRDILAL
jgi:hypothetical protein